MVHWPVPCTLKQLRGFLGLTGYYRRFIACFASITAPLTDLLPHNAFLWGPKVEIGFVKLKEAMTQAPVLCLPDFTREFMVETDTSDCGIGIMLMRDTHPIAFFIKKKIVLSCRLLLLTSRSYMLSLMLYVSDDNIYWVDFLSSRHIIKVLRSCFNK